ncbi:MAG: hypothetical protein SGPRY_002517 [Prymnesium sp.]
MGVDWVISKLEQFKRAGVAFTDIAVLYRTHAVGRQLTSGLRARHVPSQPSAADTFARPDITPLLSLLTLLANPHDSTAFVTESDTSNRQYAPRDGHTRPECLIHQEWQAPLHQFLHSLDLLERNARVLPPSELLGEVVRSRLLDSLKPEALPYGIRLLARELTAKLEYQEEAPSLHANSARAHTTDRLEMLRAYLEHAAMSEAEGSGAGAISPLCSGFDEDGESPQRVHEERRLTYVGMTRAKERLLLSYVMSGPDGQPQSASRFLGEVAGGLLVRTQHYELLSEAGRTGD